MRFALAFLALAAVPAFAQADDCNTVRRTLQLAERNGVDTGNLWRLERRLCAPTPSTNGAGATCEHLDAFYMLALATGAAGEVTGGLEAQRGVWCGRADEPQRQLQWPGGTTLRSTSGTLYWPDGTMARSTSGTWYAQTGAIVKSTSGSLSYPNGVLLRSTTGRLTMVSGEYVDEGRLAAKACNVDRNWCRYFLGEASSSSGVRRDFALLGLALLAERD